VRVVLDTNVLVAAFIARGLCAELFETVLAHHQLVVGDVLLEELERVMTAKLGFTPQRVREALALLRRVGKLVSAEPLAAPMCRDPDDDAVLALARSARADCIVTGDDDLLVLERFEGIPILSPREFWTFER
jgi:putative PIN family toxin of toxin-antitoxin system